MNFNTRKSSDIREREKVRERRQERERGKRDTESSSRDRLFVVAFVSFLQMMTKKMPAKSDNFLSVPPDCGRSGGLVGAVRSRHSVY